MSFTIKLPVVVLALVFTACTVKEYQEPPPSAPPVMTSDGQPVEEEGASDVGVDPPAPQPEPVAVARPSPQHVWIAGHWVWRGRWIWLGGRWALGAPGAVWIPGYWHHGPKGRWHWVRGHWR